ncbi:hypothetical protein ACTXT7_011570 [Hymenolepis weldensis]
MIPYNPSYHKVDTHVARMDRTEQNALHCENNKQMEVRMTNEYTVLENWIDNDGPNLLCPSSDSLPEGTRPVEKAVSNIRAFRGFQATHIEKTLQFVTGNILVVSSFKFTALET